MAHLSRCSSLAVFVLAVEPLVLPKAVVAPTLLQKPELPAAMGENQSVMWLNCTSRDVYSSLKSGRCAPECGCSISNGTLLRVAAPPADNLLPQMVKLLGALPLSGAVISAVGVLKGYSLGFEKGIV